LSCLGFQDIVQLTDPTYDDLDKAFRNMTKKVLSKLKVKPTQRFFLSYFFAGHGEVDHNGIIEVDLEKEKRFKPSDRLRSLTGKHNNVTTLGVYDCCRVGSLKRAH